MSDTSDSISQFAFGETNGGEHAFAYPRVLDAITWCSAHSVAVLGVELFVGPFDGFFTDALSSYELVAGRITWPKFVEENNRAAMQFVKDHRAGDNQFYLLTTVCVIVAAARDGRDSPLKYTSYGTDLRHLVARDGRDSPLKYTAHAPSCRAPIARDGRDSPLKYTAHFARCA